jgi:hypothetical protein
MPFSYSNIGLDFFFIGSVCSPSTSSTPSVPESLVFGLLPWAFFLERGSRQTRKQSA